MLPKLILFDLDDTLSDHLGTVGRALAETARHFPVLARRPLGELVAENQRILEELHPAVCSGELHPDESRLTRLQHLFRFCGAECPPEEARAVAAVYIPAYQNNQRAVEGARELLEWLRGKARVGIVTNNPTAEQEAKLKAVGLGDLVDFMVTSEDVGVMKPQPGIYLRALQLAGVEGADAVFVGDAWVNDVVGPQAVGIPAIWISWGRPAPETPRPLAVAGTLADVQPMLERMQGTDAGGNFE